jgi:ribosomal protein L35AE/L33A
MSPSSDVRESLTIGDVTVTEGNAGTVDATFTVTLAPASLGPVSVDYATANDTASAPADYTAVAPTTLHFSAGETSKTVTVSVNGDALDEANETFFVNLTNAVGGASIDDPQGVGTITDDDPLPALSINGAAVTEGDAGTVNATFTVGLSSPSGRTVSVDYSSADGSATAPADYAASSSTLTFAAGETTKAVTVPVAGDALDEVNETFSVNLSNASNATIADAQGTGTITDDDPLPALTVNDVSRDEGNSGAVAATFTVTLAPASGRTVTVEYATQNGTATAGVDYQATSGTLSFAAGETTKTITVLVNGDLADEADETFFLNLTNPVSATIADTQGSGTIIDDDGQPTLSIDDASLAEGNSGTVNATFTVTLSQASGQIVTVDYSTLDGSATAPADYTAVAGSSLVFNPGQTTKTVNVQVTGDLLDEIDESFTVSLSNPNNATIGDGLGLGTINDDDAGPALSINDTSTTEGDAGTTAATFTVSLGAPSGRLVTVDYATANGTAIAPGDYATAGGTLSFAAGETSKTVTVAIKGDTLDEPNETFSINLSNPSNASIGDSAGTGTITDNDPMPTLAVNDVTVTEGNSGTVNATFTVTLAPVSGRTVTVDYATANDSAVAPADYSAASSVLTFSAGETSKTLTVLVKGDPLDEVNETYFLNLTAPAGATLADSQGVGTIIDDDGPPALSIDNQSVTEGQSGTVNANFTVTLAPAAGQTATVNYSTSDGTATAPSDYAATSGTLTFPAGTTARTITVPVTGDLVHELTESFTVTLSSAANANIDDDQGVGTILDTDPLPELRIDNPEAVAEGDTGAVPVTFTVSLNTPSGLPTSVQYATVDGTASAPADYAAASGTLNFAAGETTKTVTVLVNGDALNELTETFFVDLASPSGATIVDGQGVGTIANDDPAAAPPPPPPPPPPPESPPPLSPPLSRPPSQRKTTSALLSPLNGARLTAPPLLRWRSVPRARFYNVQLYLAGRKILSFHPSKPQYKLHRQWTYQGRKYRLRKGAYTWLVWPAFGTKRRPQFGAMLGQSTFRMVK